MYDPKSSKLAKLRSLARIARARAKEGHASVGRQLIEIIRLWLANGMTAPDYYCRGLYRKDLPWREKAEHLGARPYTRGLRCVNGKRYEYLAQNKLAAYGLFRAFNLPTPKVHAVVGREAGRTWDGRTVATSEDLVDTIRKIGESRLCFKLVDGWSGKGFVRADVLVGGESVSLAIQPDGKPVTIEEFWGDVIRRNGSYMI